MRRTFFLAVIAALFLSFGLAPSAGPPSAAPQAYAMVTPSAMQAGVSTGVVIGQTRADRTMNPESYMNFNGPSFSIATYDKGWVSTSTEFSRPPADPSFSGGSADLTPLLTSTTEALIGPDSAIPLRV